MTVNNSPPPPNSKGAILVLIGAAIIWGTSFILVDRTVDQLDTSFPHLGFLISLFYRLFFAFVSSLLIFIGCNLKILRSQLFYFKRKTVYLLTFLNIGGYLFQFLAAAYTDSAKLALLVNANIILVPLLSYRWLHETINYRKIGGMIIGVVGLFFVTTGGLFIGLLEGELFGNLISLFGGVSWAFYILLSRKVMAEENTRYKPLNLSLITTFLSFIFLIPLSLVFYIPFTSAVLDATFPWWELTYLGVLCTTIAYWLFYVGIKSVSATNTTYILLLETVLGVFIGIVIGSELFTIFTAIGAGLVFLSIIIINLS